MIQEADAGSIIASSPSSDRVLLTEGARHQQIYLIESGTATVEVGGQEVAQLGPGSIVGELGFFLGEAATATVRATDAKLT